MRPDFASRSGAALMPAEAAGPLRPTLLVSGTAFRFGEGVGTAMERTVATEVPVQMLFADIPFGIMMASPADLEDFAYGFSLTEGVIGAPSEIRGVSVEPDMVPCG